MSCTCGDGYLLPIYVQMPFYGCSDVQTTNIFKFRFSFRVSVGLGLVKLDNI